MNLSDALAHVDAMTPAEKAAWDQANGFTTDAMRDIKATVMLDPHVGLTVPEGYDTPDRLIAACNDAHNAWQALDGAVAVLRIWPGDPDQNFPSVKEWLEEA